MFVWKKFSVYLRFLCYLLVLEQIIFEGVYALHPDIRGALDLWIAVVSNSMLQLNFARSCFWSSFLMSNDACYCLSNRLEVFIHT